MINKDEYFLNVAQAVSLRSKCLSRQVGAVLVRDGIIISTGYNGPPRGVPHCGFERIDYDKFDGALLSELKQRLSEKPEITRASLKHECPRSVLGYNSSEGLHLCIAAHAERNCICSAARLGVSTTVPLRDTIMYVSCEIPCKDCLIEIINAGIKEVVVIDKKYYDSVSEFLIKNSSLNIRKYIHLEEE